ncbi:MAG: thiamine pyrophosphate-dependent enzyme, partial [Bacillota bacterium]
MEYVIERFSSTGIAHQSYLLGSDTEAAVIDPRRDWWTYTERAAELGMHIRYVFETHRNEDLVTGSCDLMRETGARVFHGDALDFEYGETVNDGDEFSLGKLKVRALATPGHTPESFSYAVIHPEAGEEAVAVFTGDAMFVGEVGRTDFYPDRARELATALYRSIHEQILPLGEGVMLYPAHGAGSACGNSISERNDSTLGLEKVQNPILLVEAKTYCYRGHWEGDPEIYRTPKEMEEWRKKDSIKKAETKLLKEKVLKEKDIENFRNKIAK